MSRPVNRPVNLEKQDLALARLRNIFAELENRQVDRNCIGRTDCCRFKLTGEVPYVTLPEAILAQKALKKTGRKSTSKIQTSPPARDFQSKKQAVPKNDGACPCLDESGKCLIYNDRPFPCRTHFCESAGGVVPRKKIRDLIQQLDELDEFLGGRGPVQLPKAIEQKSR